jgi:hypothetical protein
MTMTPQQRMKARLESLGLPYREVKVYGSQISVECACQATASKWASLIAEFARLKGVIESLAYTKSTEGCFSRDSFKVWRVHAVV